MLWSEASTVGIRHQTSLTLRVFPDRCAEPHPVVAGRRRRDAADHRRPGWPAGGGWPFLRRRRHQRGRNRREGGGPGLHLRLRSGPGRVGQLADRRFPGRRAAATDPAARAGFLFLDRDKFHASFAADVPAEVAAFMADSQVPWGLDALGGLVTDPAWRTKPSWYLVTTEDQMIPPAAQRTMSQRAGSTVVEVGASHSVYVPQPAAVADLMKQAVAAIAAPVVAGPVSSAQIRGVDLRTGGRVPRIRLSGR